MGMEDDEGGTRPMTYCIVPRDLAGKLHELLRRHFAEDSSVEVVVECRDRARRSGSDRRVDEASAAERPATAERRRIRNRAGRRVGERRSLVVAVAVAPELPRKAQRYRDRLTFFERVERVGQRVEDEDSERLVGRMQGGDGEAFGELYERYFNRVYAYMSAVFRNPSEAEDVTQQVFLRVFEALPRYVRRTQPFRAWLFVIARNHAINELRRSERAELLVTEPANGRPGETPADGDLSALGWITDRDLHLFLERLPLSQRQVLFLRYVFGFSAEETAKILGESTDAVHKQHSRALVFLRQRLTSVGRTPVGPRSRHGSERVLRKSWVLRRRRFSLIAPR